MTITTRDCVVSSPCIGVCTLDVRGYCIGCWRTMGEISDWLSLTEQQRINLIQNILPQRQQDYFDSIE